jgi:hypothetical protein
MDGFRSLSIRTSFSGPFGMGPSSGAGAGEERICRIRFDEPGTGGPDAERP